jgi:cytochrome P450 PksS
MTTEVRTYPILNAATRANPQPMYAQMRQHDPIYCAVGPVTGNQFWFFTRYEDVVAVLRDQRFVKNARKNLKPEYAFRYVAENPDPIWESINRHLLASDPPDHTRLRGLVHKGFTPKRVRDLEPRIRQIADDLLNAIGEKESGDLLNDFAFPLPITVIAEMLGVHIEMRDKFREWTQALLFGMDESAGQIAVMEFVQYVNELIEERRAEDKGDILSALVSAEEDGDQLEHMELLSMVFLLLVAGHETTVNLIGNGTLALMQNPDAMQQLQENPSLIRSAVEEMLRYNGPVETPIWSFASQDVEISGVVIPEGDVVMPSLLAANRDPAVFENPDTFDITRDPNPHVAFGHGIHYCLGAPLARMEGAIAINALLERYPGIQLNAATEDLQWNSSLLIHGLKSLPVTYR